ncbi:hypothetical protein [Candidatus Amarolinea dominans]|uniref:hypothetical protein n=1 Tax=Candidatus Amarolinea dominans TaxID=3140696 RepID=UPI001D69992A|nr:hypothetical protein [Anaerolineae bacterium]
MKTRRQFLCVAWLAVCALLLLSACRGPTPIAGRVAEITATRGASNTPLPAPDTATPTATPTRPAIDTATPTDTNTPIVDPTETSTPTPTAEMVMGPAIAGLSLKPDGKGGMQYVAEKGNPYGVAVGEVVGRPTSIQVKGIGGKVRNPIDGTFEEVGFVRQSAVVISNPKVLAYFTNKENTPEKVRGTMSEWRSRCRLALGLRRGCGGFKGS